MMPLPIKIDCEAELNMPKVSRLEVIGPDGRELVKYGVGLYAQLQDDGRTLKIFYHNVGLVKSSKKS